MSTAKKATMVTHVDGRQDNGLYAEFFARVREGETPLNAKATVELELSLAWKQRAEFLTELQNLMNKYKR